MYLTLSKRFELSTSIRLAHPGWSREQNETYYGPHTGGEHGHGYNYIVYFVFHGPVDPQTGMMINITDIKRKVNSVLNERYDHKFLNVDTRPFELIPPTPENIARQLLAEMTPLFEGCAAQPMACHLEATPDTSATAYAGGRVERRFTLRFSAARRTYSPHLSDEENLRMFGVASSAQGHGHGYHVKVTLKGAIDPHLGQIVPYRQSQASFDGLLNVLDHKNLYVDVVELAGLPITTEALALFIFDRLRRDLPVSRVRLNENDYFFAEYSDNGNFKLGLEKSFHAAHRLHSPLLSEAQNKETYGKCNNPAGHGHLYRVEATLGGNYDERSGTLYDLLAFDKGMTEALQPWSYKHLDLETEDFHDRPSTGENIVSTLWPRLDRQLGGRLERISLWETPNNRFTLRKGL